MTSVEDIMARFGPAGASKRFPFSDNGHLSPVEYPADRLDAGTL
jgi:hypothetical protein